MVGPGLVSKEVEVPSLMTYSDCPPAAELLQAVISQDEEKREGN